MLIYILLTIAIFAVSRIHYQIHIGIIHKKRLVISAEENRYICWFLLLTLVAGLRGENVGTDTRGYLQIFLANNGLDMVISRQEFLFELLCKAIGLFTDNPQWLLVICAAQINICVLYFIKHNSSYPALSVFFFIALYYYFISLNVIRQFMAIGLVLVATESAKKRKLIPFLICIFLAFSFHKTAILGLSLWYIYKKPISINRLVPIAIAITATICLFPFAIHLVQHFWGRYNGYYSGGSGKSGGIMMLVVYSFIFLASFFVACLDPKWRREPNNIALLLIAEIAMIWGFSPLVIRGLSSTTIQRLGWLFQVYSIALLPRLLKSSLFNRKRAVWYILFVLVGIAHMFYFLRANHNGVMPYRFFWQ